MRRQIIAIISMIFVVGILLFIAVTNQRAEESSVGKYSTKNLDEINEKVLAQNENNGKIVSKEFVKNFEQSEINSLSQPFYQSSNQYIPSEYPVSQYTITYNTTNENDEILENTAQVYVPITDTETEFPLYVFGSGTTGINDQCAPSKEVVENDNWGDYRAHMLSYAAQGYIVIFPDYEGFNDGPERIHHYFHRELEARVMLDAAWAGHEFFNNDSVVKPSGNVFFAGYSQGGHAAFAAKDLAASYAPDIPIKGVIGYGSTNNLRNLLRENPQLSPYLFVAFNDLYGDETVSYNRLVLLKWAQNLEQNAKSKCVTAVSKFFPLNQKDIYTSEFIAALEDNEPGEFTEFFKVLEQNSTGYTRSEIPAMVVQGSIDPIVSNDSTEEFIEKSCASGNVITYKLYPGVHHYQTRQVSFKDSLQWMEDRIKGKQAQNDC